MKKICMYILVLLATAAICSCKSNTAKQTVPVGYSEKDVSGGRDIENVNIQAVTASQNDSTTNISIQFTQGSNITGSGSVSLACLPKYTVSKVASPYAIAIKLGGVGYTEFERSLDISSAHLVNAVFFDDVSSTLYIRTTCDFAFLVTENTTALNISFVKTDKQKDTNEFAYYVTSNTYNYYKNGYISFSKLFPTQTRDGRMILISSAFEKQKDAAAFLNKLAAENKAFAGSFEVVAMYYNELPIYNDDLDYSRSYTVEFIRKDNTPKVADCLIPDGYFFADNGGLIYEKQTETGKDSYTELYILKNGKSTPLVNFEFSNIETISFSPDNRKLAVLENSLAGSHLYIFDTVNGKLLYDLSDSGLGKRISGFAWNELGTAIYAMGGSDTIAINMYDFSINDETKRKSCIYSGQIDEGSFALFGGKLYFTQNSENGSVIHSLKPEIGVNSMYAHGSAFAFSEKHVAITTATTVASTDATPSLYILDVNTNEKTMITQDFAVYDFAWSQSGNLLYYIENRLSGEDTATDFTESDTATGSTLNADSYPYTLYCYDVSAKKSEKLCDMKTYGRLCIYGEKAAITYFDGDNTKTLVRSTYTIGK